MNNGYTGSNKYEPAGTVHRGEFYYAPCSCGGLVHAYADGELIAHSKLFVPAAEHEVKGLGIKIWRYELVE